MELLLTVEAWLTFTFISIKNACDMKILTLTNSTLTSAKHLSATNFFTPNGLDKCQD
jgi:hypothetical protein